MFGESKGQIDLIEAANYDCAQCSLNVQYDCRSVHPTNNCVISTLKL